jgi:hypothetical protein
LKFAVISEYVVAESDKRTALHKTVKDAGAATGVAVPVLSWALPSDSARERLAKLHHRIAERWKCLVVVST